MFRHISIEITGKIPEVLLVEVLKNPVVFSKGNSFEEVSRRISEASPA